MTGERCDLPTDSALRTGTHWRRRSSSANRLSRGHFRFFTKPFFSLGGRGGGVKVIEYFGSLTFPALPKMASRTSDDETWQYCMITCAYDDSKTPCVCRFASMLDQSRLGQFSFLTCPNLGVLMGRKLFWCSMVKVEKKNTGRDT